VRTEPRRYRTTRSDRDSPARGKSERRPGRTCDHRVGGRRGSPCSRWCSRCRGRHPPTTARAPARPAPPPRTDANHRRRGAPQRRVPHGPRYHAAGSQKLKRTSTGTSLGITSMSPAPRSARESPALTTARMPSTASDRPRRQQARAAERESAATAPARSPSGRPHMQEKVHEEERAGHRRQAVERRGSSAARTPQQVDQARQLDGDHLGLQVPDHHLSGPAAQQHDADQHHAGQPRAHARAGETPGQNIFSACTRMPAARGRPSRCEGSSPSRRPTGRSRCARPTRRLVDAVEEEEVDAGRDQHAGRRRSRSCPLWCRGLRREDHRRSAASSTTATRRSSTRTGRDQAAGRRGGGGPTGGDDISNALARCRQEIGDRYRFSSWSRRLDLAPRQLGLAPILLDRSSQDGGPVPMTFDHGRSRPRALGSSSP